MSSLPPVLVPPLDDNRLLVELIVKATGKSAEWVRDGLRKEEDCLGYFMRVSFKDWKLTPHVWDDRLVEYYRTSYSEIMGYAVWNRGQEKREMRRWIGRHLQRTANEPLSILTVGDGAGFDSLFLSLCGHDVIYSEESESSIRFAKVIFEHSNRSIKIVSDVRAVEPESVDVIVCLDVLEHVPDPPAFVGEMASRLKPGGQLIVHAPFFFVSWHNPTHLRSNIRYSGNLKSVYTINRLELIDGRMFWDPIVLGKRKSEESLSRNPLTLAKLWISGGLLAAARIWNGPHNWIASRIAMRR